MRPYWLGEYSEYTILERMFASSNVAFRAAVKVYGCSRERRTTTRHSVWYGKATQNELWKFMDKTSRAAKLFCDAKADQKHNLPTCLCSFMRGNVFESLSVVPRSSSNKCDFIKRLQRTQCSTEDASTLM